jgi:phosphohistidine swiveling domain-containing protein
MNRPDENHDIDDRSSVKHFNELTSELYKAAGGKGSMLAKMFQAGYPIPEGFIVLPTAFQNNELRRSVQNIIVDYLQAIRKKHQFPLFAVRSSALSEDSAQTSFAGEFETILNVQTDDEIFAAIDQVYRSTESDRVKTYSSVHGIDSSHQIAIVIQLMIKAEISGVLFTADPITGSRSQMIGNYVYGLGEQLVSGETNAHSFTLKRPRGTYRGASELRKFAYTLYKLAIQLEKEENIPQDLEWAVANGKLYLLQARPITTLSPGNLDTYEWNDTFHGDFIWTSTNVGEAIPDVMTPMTWSLLRKLDLEANLIPGHYLSGNICGRSYTNISQFFSVIKAFGIDPRSEKVSAMFDAFGEIPSEMEIPLYPFSKRELIQQMTPKLIRYVSKLRQGLKNLDLYLEKTPNWCLQTTEKVKLAKTEQALLQIWQTELDPYQSGIWFALLAAGNRSSSFSSPLSAKLSKLVGKEDANLLLSNLRQESGLASLGPVVGISDVIKGKMSREDYLQKYGHRGPHEFELSIPHPAEEKDWLETQIKEYLKAEIDVDQLLHKQQIQYEEAFTRFKKRYPRKRNWLKRQLAKASKKAAIREAARSEFIRVHRVNRFFLLRAAELTGLKEDVFFLYLDELLSILAGEKSSALVHLPKRKASYEKYKTLPPLPSLIRGRFDPFQWAQDPNRRLDYYDASLPLKTDSNETLNGFAGAAGRIEGRVRVVATPEEGKALLPGEILVTSTTNVGWTPLFPKAAAIITDVGAPLSHAAIVARELGIPAVVGCGNATTRLKTGDRVIVDGGQGVVQILD